MSSTLIAGTGNYDDLTVGAVAVLVVPAKASRKRVYIRNTHATEDLHIGLDDSVTTSTGWKLDGADSAASGTSVLVLEGYNGPVYAVASGAGTTGNFIEIG